MRQRYEVLSVEQFMIETTAHLGYRPAAEIGQSICVHMSMRGLFIPQAAPWRLDFEAELLRFPAGVHDDQADALGLIGQLLDTVRPGQVANTPVAPKYENGSCRAVQTGSGSWRV